MSASTDLKVDWVYDATTVQLLPRVAGTYGYRQLVNPLDFGTADMTRWLDPIPFGTGVVERGYVFDRPRRVRMGVHIAAGTERKAWSEWEDLQGNFRADREGKIRLRYTEADGPTERDRYLLARRVMFDTMSWPGITTFKGAYSGGVLRTHLELEATYPHWRSYTGSTDTVAISTSSTPITITNSGHFPIGLKFALSALVGTWTSITISNATNGPGGATVDPGGTVVWTDAGFSNSDEIDWRYTDPSLVTWTSGSTLGATSHIVLWPGINTVSVVGVGGTSGTGTFSWAEAWT